MVVAVYLKGKKLRKSHEYSAQLVVAVHVKEKFRKSSGYSAQLVVAAYFNKTKNKTNSENPTNIVHIW